MLGASVRWTPVGEHTDAVESACDARDWEAVERLAGIEFARLARDHAAAAPDVAFAHDVIESRGLQRSLISFRAAEEGSKHGQALDGRPVLVEVGLDGTPRPWQIFAPGDDDAALAELDRNPHERLLASLDVVAERVIDARARPGETGPAQILAAAHDSLLLREGDAFTFNEVKDGRIVHRVLCDDERHALEWAEAFAVRAWFERHWAAGDTDTIVSQRVARDYRFAQHRSYDRDEVNGREAARGYYRHSRAMELQIDVQLVAVRGPARLARLVYTTEGFESFGPTEAIIWAAYWEPDSVLVRQDFYEHRSEASEAFEALAALGERRPEEILEVEPHRVVVREAGRIQELTL